MLQYSILLYAYLWYAHRELYFAKAAHETWQLAYHSFAEVYISYSEKCFRGRHFSLWFTQTFVKFWTSQMVHLTKRGWGREENGMKRKTWRACTILFVNPFAKRQPWRVIRASRARLISERVQELYFVRSWNRLNYSYLLLTVVSKLEHFCCIY